MVVIVIVIMVVIMIVIVIVAMLDIDGLRVAFVPTGGRRNCK